MLGLHCLIVLVNLFGYVFNNVPDNYMLCWVCFVCWLSSHALLY